jgi:outer membrane protein assembly factor BamB
LAEKVCSTELFAISLADGSRKWQYRGGTIINTSIAISKGAVVFVESGSAARTEKSGRVADSQFWKDTELVALDLKTGRQLWRQAVDVGPANTMLSLACSRGHVVLVGSGKGIYRIAVLSQRDGTAQWKTQFPWEAKGKGGDSARPAILDDRLFVSPRAFELATGKPLEIRLTRGACGSYAAAKNVFLTRLGDLGLWNPDANQSSTWERLRPDCWLSAIPAGGLILAPEGGGGCSCGGWLETSIAFRPKQPAGK